MDGNGKEVIVAELVDTEISPQHVRAVQALRSAKVPPQHIRKHPGKGGKTFSYVPHTIATQTMNDALGFLWDYEVLEVQLLPDFSGIARARMTIHWMDKAGEWHQRVITEIGAKEAVKDMSHSFILASAASRALLRCMLRAFDYGMELYSSAEDDGALTPGSAWVILKKHAEGKKITETELTEAIKEAGITNETLVDRYEEAYALVQALAEKKAMPNLNAKKEEPKAEQPKTEGLAKKNPIAERIKKSIMADALLMGIMKAKDDKAGAALISEHIMPQIKDDLETVTAETSPALIAKAKELLAQLQIDLAKPE